MPKRTSGPRRDASEHAICFGLGGARRSLCRRHLLVSLRLPEFDLRYRQYRQGSTGRCYGRMSAGAAEVTATHKYHRHHCSRQLTWDRCSSSRRTSSSPSAAVHALAPSAPLPACPLAPASNKLPATHLGPLQLQHASVLLLWNDVHPRIGGGVQRPGRELARPCRAVACRGGGGAKRGRGAGRHPEGAGKVGCGGQGSTGSGCGAEGAEGRHARKPAVPLRKSHRLQPRYMALPSSPCTPLPSPSSRPLNCLPPTHTSTLLC